MTVNLLFTELSKILLE